MTDRRIIFRENNGAIKIVIPAPKALQAINIETIANKASKGLPWRIIDKSELPMTREFREAWRDINNSIQIDMIKARELHMDRIRKARNIRLKELDIEQLKGNDVQLQKQVLRDIPQVFDLSSEDTAEKLKLRWPEELINYKPKEYE